MLTRAQSAVLTGLMLGDGHLSIGGKSVNPRLRINRAASDIGYAQWIAEMFAGYTTSKSLSTSTVYDPRYDRTYARTAFSTRRDSDFLRAFRMWYPDGEKRLPDVLRLSALTVAVWFADDGSLYQKTKAGGTSGVELAFSTCGFTETEVDRLAELLSDRYSGGFKKYGGYGNVYFKVMASTRPAMRLLRDIDPVFPPLARKSKRWRTLGHFLNCRPVCPECCADMVYRNGFYAYGVKLQRFKCRACGFAWKEPLKAR
jgi:LAGLIDADG DNA endonuclease family